jgi:hypothetical protein
LTDDEEGYSRLIRELTEATYDGVAIGGFINGQDPDVPPSEQTTRWYNRALNLIHIHAPEAKIILMRNPPDAIPAIERVLGPSSDDYPWWRSSRRHQRGRSSRPANSMGVRR